MNKESLILIIGAGSIGERHIRNLWELGYQNLVVYRQRNLPFRDIGEANVQVELNWENIVARKPFAAFICTPTSQHLEQTRLCLRNNMHVFVEKPLSHNLENLHELTELVSNSNKLLQVGFMMRYHPHILCVKKYIEQNRFGKLISSSSHWGSYLPDWHPWENYKDSYAAKTTLGGGVALTLCHDIDLAIWLSGNKVDKFKTTFSYSPELEIDAESIANITLSFENGSSAYIHLNYLDKPPIRKYQWIFENALIDFDYFDNELVVKSQSEMIEHEIFSLDKFERNQMFLDEIKDFFVKTETIINPSEYAFDQIKESELLIKICNADD